MSALTAFAAQNLPTHSHATMGTVADLYHCLLASSGPSANPQAISFLRTQLVKTQDLPCDMPSDPKDLGSWIAQNVAKVASEYGDYLDERHAGAPRRFFSNKSHALYFLQQIAPTKLVDGAWLYSTLQHAGDFRYHGLIRTYLEELGDGDPALNHVSLYRKLLAEHDCAPAYPLDDELYLSGAVQLALGHAGDEFLPEVIGYNLGYEQLPLHLLISAFELNELGIDPYYFTLHVTIDNASTGHAQKALQAVNEFLLGAPDKTAFLARVQAGYRLNELGVGSSTLIRSFELERELIEMLERKRTFGQHMHSDYCRLEGRTVNEWLATPGQIPKFLRTLESKGWIKRHQDPDSSRFWQLTAGPGAAMFGVFSGYELQLLHDWIAGDWRPGSDGRADDPFRARWRNRAASSAPLPPTRGRARLADLVGHLSPALHPTPVGLEATRVFSGKLSRGEIV